MKVVHLQETNWIYKTSEKTHNEVLLTNALHLVNFMTTYTVNMSTSDSETQRILSEKDSVINKWLLLDIITIIFFATICSSVPLPFFARNYTKRGGSYVLAGVIMQIYPVAIGCSAWIFGKLIPRFGYKPIAIFGVLIEGTAQIGFAIASFIEDVTTYSIISVIMRILAGTGNAAAITTVFAIAAADFGTHSTFILGVLESTTGVSYLVGPLIGAGLYKINNTMFVPLLLPGVLYIFSSLHFALCYKQGRDQENYTSVKFSSVFKILFNKTLLGLALVQMCVLGVFAYLAVYLTIYVEELGMTVMESGALVSITAVFYMIGSLINGKLIPKYHDYTLVFMLVGLLGWATDMLSLTITNSKLRWLVYVAFSFHGITDSTLVVSIFHYSLDYLKTMDIDVTFNKRTSCIAGIWISSINIGKFLFSTMGGFVIQYTGSVVKTNIGFVLFGYTLTAIVFTVNTPKGQLLVYNCKEGWEPLCEFLGVPVPEDRSFPYKNSAPKNFCEDFIEVHPVYKAISRQFKCTVTIALATICLGVFTSLKYFKKI